MPSPFPGMDPYLEEPSLWPDVHAAMLVMMRMDLNAVLPERYSAYIDRYVWLEDADRDRERGGVPDLYVADRNVGHTEVAHTATLAAPASETLVLPALRRTGTRFLRIVDRGTRRIVTLIELLSHSNKAGGADGQAYLAKRRDCFATGTNLVEIDLLRAGERTPPTNEWDYRILVSRASDFPRVEVWNVRLREALPSIPIPLNPGDGEPVLNLQSCLNRTYDGAPYAKDIDYSQPPVPPLGDADAEWANALLSSRT